MKRFAEFIAEKFVAGIQGMFRYTEIFRDPDYISEVIGNEPAPRSFWELGIWVTKDHVWVWKRSNSDHMSVLQQMDGKIPGNAYPGYIKYYPQKKSSVVEFAYFSARRGQNGGLNTLMTLLKMCKGAKAFGKLRKDPTDID